MTELRRYKVYTASKTSRAPEWRVLKDAWPEVEFTARWPWYVDRIPQDPQYARIFWVHDLEDVAKSDAVLVIGSDGEKLKGPLIEAGAAIAMGKQVIVIGTHPDYNTWQYHPQVHRASTLDEARTLLELLAQ